MASHNPIGRQRIILGLLGQHKSVSVSELSRHFQVSSVTIRADLSDLEEQGLLTRTHGGAVLPAPAFEPDPAFAQRRIARSEEKQRMGAVAASMVGDGEAIALDASTSALAIASQLKHKHELIVVTNGLMAAIELAQAPGIDVVVPGGALRSEAFSLVGAPSTDCLAHINISKGFFGARGLTLDEGLTDVDDREVAAKRVLIGQCKEVIGVVDSSKWNHLAPVSLAPLDRVHRIISDMSAPVDMVEALRERGIRVALV